MKSKLLVLLIISYLSIFDIAAQHTLTLEDVTFDENTGTITNYNGSFKDIVIPPSFSINGKDVSVINIGNKAFYQDSITKVTIPNSVVNIDANAFARNSISNIIIPNSVKTIRRFAFARNVIDSIIIPNSVIIIEEEAFLSNCIKSVIIPSSVTDIRGGAFNDNYITKINGKLSTGIIYARNKDGTDDSTRIISYGGVSDTIDFIPNSVTTIGMLAFGRNDLDSIIIPNNVININYGAFLSNSLKSVIIPNSVKSIDEWAFYGNSLRSIIIPKSVTTIQKAAFNINQINHVNGQPSNGLIYARKSDGTDDSTTLVSYGGLADTVNFIPNSVITIGYDAFYGTRIDSVVIPSSVTIIQYGAFYANELKNVTIPNSVTIIGDGAFAKNPLTYIDLPDTVIKEGYSFIEWHDGNGNVVSEITNFNTTYEAQFNFTGFIVSGKIISNSDKKDVILKISGDISNIIYVNDDGSYSFALNPGRCIIMKPVKNGYSFSPDSIIINNIQENITDQNFTMLLTSANNPTISPVRVFPNPFSDRLNIKFPKKYTKLQVINLNGKVLKTVNCTGVTSISLNMGVLSQGIYFIKLISKNNTLVRKIVKQ